MSDLDLTEATVAAYAAIDPDEVLGPEEWDPAIAVAISVAAPVIERQVRERIAAALLAEVSRTNHIHAFEAYEHAADIARGGAA